MEGGPAFHVVRVGEVAFVPETVRLQRRDHASSWEVEYNLRNQSRHICAARVIVVVRPSPCQQEHQRRNREGHPQAPLRGPRELDGALRRSQVNEVEAEDPKDVTKSLLESLWPLQVHEEGRAVELDVLQVEAQDSNLAGTVSTNSPGNFRDPNSIYAKRQDVLLSFPKSSFQFRFDRCR